jgi:hypothetical protein
MRFKHHIIPLHEWRRRINPKANRHNKEYNAPDNVVWLTLEQHIQVHQLLYELNGSECDRIAYSRMSGQMGCWEATIAAARLANTGKKHTEETKHKWSVMRMGSKHTEEWKRDTSSRMKGNTFCVGYKYTLEQREARSRGMIGKQNALGTIQTAENKRRKSEAAKKRWKLWREKKETLLLGPSTNIILNKLPPGLIV